MSKKHGDLIVETTVNREVKVRGGPMQGRYSTVLYDMNIFAKNSHLLAKLRRVLKERIHLLTSSNQKETTLVARKKHENKIKRLVTKLGEVLDPFRAGSAKNIKFGTLLDDLIVKGLLKSDDNVEKHLQDFILKRIKVNAVRFFAPIKSLKLKTVFEVKVQEAKVISQLREDKQAFGLLVAKEISSEEVYSYPLTTCPFALSDPSDKLQQSQQDLFKSYLISEFKSTRKEVPTDADWIYDGMAVVRAMPIKPTWKELADTFLEAVIPQEYLHPTSIQIIMDTYDDNRIKEITQTPRGISGRGSFISNEGQTMPQNTNDWNNFLDNGENKTELINFFLRYFSTEKYRFNEKYFSLNLQSPGKSHHLV